MGSRRMDGLTAAKEEYGIFTWGIYCTCRMWFI